MIIVLTYGPSLLQSLICFLDAGDEGRAKGLYKTLLWATDIRPRDYSSSSEHLCHPSPYLPHRNVWPLVPYTISTFVDFSHIVKRRYL